MTCLSTIPLPPGSFSLPDPSEGFHEVLLPELGLPRALQVVAQQRREARAWLQVRAWTRVEGASQGMWLKWASVWTWV